MKFIKSALTSLILAVSLTACGQSPEQRAEDILRENMRFPDKMEVLGSGVTEFGGGHYKVCILYTSYSLAGQLPPKLVSVAFSDDVMDEDIMDFNGLVSSVDDAKEFGDTMYDCVKQIEAKVPKINLYLKNSFNNSR